MTLRKAYVVAVLLAFTGDITFLHRGILYIVSSLRSTVAAARLGKPKIEHGLIYYLL